MQSETEAKTKHGCCSPESEMKPTRLSRALSTLNQNSSTFNTPHSPLLTLGNKERKAIEAYKLQVEMRRSMAIEYARRYTIR
ncbi:MAG: hypothetical protein OEY24_06195 [Candidatus Bathyarchaeota archaeon]|nr:hypothetical protein [Candidatus Bathyarchaeota archaeon]MDH5495278.1 hypothetical protein [Candidatus Bathyarchaeota archaeon]